MRVVIAGAGLAAQRCAEALRRRGHDGPLTMLSAEDHPPYDRPPLSKELLAGERETSSVFLRPDGWHRDNGVELRLSTPATGIDRRRRVVLTGSGELPFDRLLVATGARARRLPTLAGFDNVGVLRDLPDALTLARAVRPGARIVIVGGGFIGLEVASTARALGAGVTVLEAADAPLVSVLGARLGAWFARLHTGAGVELVTGAAIARVHGTGTVSAVELADGRRFESDFVLVAIGAQPDTAWLAAAGLPAGGVPTGPTGASAVPGIFAAGDAARPLDPVTGGPSPPGALGGCRPGRRPGGPRDPGRVAVRRGPVRLLVRPAWSADPARRRTGRRRSPRHRGGPARRRLPRHLASRSPARCRAAGRAPARALRSTPADRRSTRIRKERRMTLLPVVDEYSCSAHGDCVHEAPEVFALEEEYATVIGVGSDERVLAAARACPAGAITVFDAETRERVYPG